MAGNDNNKNRGKGDQGFASMPKDKVREIAAEGGRASHGGGNNSGEQGRQEGSSDSERDGRKDNGGQGGNSGSR